MNFDGSRIGSYASYPSSYTLGHSSFQIHCDDSNLPVNKTRYVACFLPSIDNQRSISNLLKIFPISSRNDTCLERGAESTRATPGELDHTKGGPPGQRYPADAQCKLAHGKGFKAAASKWVSKFHFIKSPIFFVLTHMFSV